MGINKRALSAILSVALVWSLTPAAAFAVEGEPAVETPDVVVSDATPEADVDDATSEDVEETPALPSEDAIPAEEVTGEEVPEAVVDDTTDVNPEAVAEETADGQADELDVDAESSEPTDAEEMKAESEEEKPQSAKPGLNIEAHVQNIGWMKSVGEGQLVGTSGQSKRVEAFKMSLTGDDIPSGSIEYQTHVQNVGWQGWVKDGALAGTTGRSLRVEAIKIRLTGELADTYDIYYQGHVQNLGWMSLAKNGEATGSSGHSYRIEAVRVWLVPKGEKAPSTQVDTSKVFYGILGLTYQAHVQDIGWQASVGSNGLAGTTGRSKRIEALKIDVTGLDIPGDITYRAHVQNVGWQGWVKNGALAGTTGRSLRVEALEVKLTGELANEYDLYYCVHVSNIGWLGWAKNGETAGSTGMSHRIEAIKVAMVPKGSGAPGGVTAAYAKPFISAASISYTAKVQNASSWQAGVKNGGTAGTTGKSLWVEGMRASISGEDGSVSYRACSPGGSWTGWSKDGADLLTSGKRFEAIQVKLSGTVATTYDVWYRAHIQNVGWTGWTKNGSSAGSTGLSFRIEAYQMRLVPKGGSAPGETYRPLVNKDNLYDAMTKKAQGYSSSTGYLIMIDTDKCYVGVYQGYRGHWNRIQYWRCSCGGPSTPTVLGVFSVFQKPLWFGHAGEYRVWYATGFYSEYYIHSVLYTDDDYQNRFVDARLGKHISQGCIRMDIKNAKWIYDKIPYGTTVVTY